MSEVQSYSELSPYDPRENQIPAYLSAGAMSIYSSYQISEKHLKVYNFRRRIPAVGAAAGLSMAASYLIWQRCALRPERQSEYGTWRSCPDCDIYQSFAYAFCVSGFAASIAGSLATGLYPPLVRNKTMPNAAPGAISKYVLAAKSMRLVFAVAAWGMGWAALRINHEKGVYLRRSGKLPTSKPAENAATGSATSAS